MSDRPTACMLLIGNELLSGRTKDANLAYIGARLNALGIRMAEARVLPDEEDVIVAAVKECRAKFDYVFTSGGIGPTHDDITAACIAKAFGVALERNAQAWALLLRNYSSAAELTEARLKMTEVPAGATLIENPVSHAPGFQIGNVFVMAGIPRILQAMFEGITDRLRGGAPMLSRAIAAAVPEGVMGGPLADLQARFPDVEIGSYPFKRGAKVGAEIVLRTVDPVRLAEAAQAVRDLVTSHGVEPEEGESGESDST